MDSAPCDSKSASGRWQRLTAPSRHKRGHLSRATRKTVPRACDDSTLAGFGGDIECTSPANVRGSEARPRLSHDREIMIVGGITSACSKQPIFISIIWQAEQVIEKAWQAIAVLIETGRQCFFDTGTVTVSAIFRDMRAMTYFSSDIRDSFRGAAKASNSEFPTNGKEDRRISKQKLLDGAGDIEMGTVLNAPPWMKNVEATQALFAIINGRKEDLSKLMAKSKRVGFDEDSEARRREQITATTAEISGLFRKCEKNIQGVLEGGDPADVQDRAMRKNVQVALATQLHELSVTFRREQQRYLDKLKDIERKSQYRPNAGGDDQIEDEGFNSGQMAMLEDVEMDVAQREREILKVAESIRDMQAIFKELAVLVIDQGSIIDRIDYNMEQAASHTAKGKEQLVKAEETQRRNPATCCIIVLAVLLFLMSLLLVLKIVGYFRL